MRVFRSGVDLQFAQHLSTERIVRQHAAYRMFDNAFWVAREQLANYYLAHAARADLCRRLGRIAEARAGHHCRDEETEQARTQGYAGGDQFANSVIARKMQRCKRFAQLACSGVEALNRTRLAASIGIRPTGGSPSTTRFAWT